MFTIKLIDENNKRNIEQVWECEHYMKTCTKDQHYLTLYGASGHDNDPVIDLKKLLEDKDGKYSRDLFIMNSSGKTIDRYSW